MDVVMSRSTVHPIVIDNGSCFIKAGLAGEDVPRIVFPSLVGTPKHEGIALRDLGQRYHHVGYETQTKRETLTVKSPFQNGVIIRWDDMEQVWHHALYNQLDLDPEGRSVILTESPLSSRSDREKMAQAMFETFNIRHLFIGNQAVLVLRACDDNMKTGVVVDSGYDVTHTVPIVDGRVIPQASHTLPLAGHQLTLFLSKLLNNEGGGDTVPSTVTTTTTTTDEAAHEKAMPIVRSIKEEHCYVALDFERDKIMKAAAAVPKMTHRLPDGNTVTTRDERVRVPEAKEMETTSVPKLTHQLPVILRDQRVRVPGAQEMKTDAVSKMTCKLPNGNNVTLGDEVVRVPEAMFQPSTVDSPGSSGIHVNVYDAIMKCDVNIRHDLFSNIALAGGNTLFPGFADRLEKEITALVVAAAQDLGCTPGVKAKNKAKVEVKVNAPPERKFSTWLGGSILGCSSTFEEMCVSKEEYDETGPAVVHKKFT